MTPEPKRKPFPWRCPKCLRKSVNPTRIPYEAQIKHDGRLYVVDVPALNVAKCDACGELVLDNRADEQITDALRKQLGLLRPDQIRSRREALNLTQKELADRLGIASETVSRWETGALVQSRAMDNLIRLYFTLPEVRAVLSGEKRAS
ncbi:MAG TPA: helix-turn-helix domain-containing protein [Phycisphaerae bacterium]|nr:helix-turn-helix domain-containing protein [Phycisphaerae bacterium]